MTALIRRDTKAWKLQVWTLFGIALAVCATGLAVGLTGWGLFRMEVNPTYKAYLLVTWLFLVSSAFSLAKMLRDDHEADVAEARLQHSQHPQRSHDKA